MACGNSERCGRPSLLLVHRLGRSEYDRKRVRSMLMPHCCPPLRKHNLIDAHVSIVESNSMIWLRRQWNDAIGRLSLACPGHQQRQEQDYRSWPNGPHHRHAKRSCNMLHAIAVRQYRAISVAQVPLSIRFARVDRVQKDVCYPRGQQAQPSQRRSQSEMQGEGRRKAPC